MNTTKHTPDGKEAHHPHQSTDLSLCMDQTDVSPFADDGLTLPPLVEVHSAQLEAAAGKKQQQQKCARRSVLSLLSRVLCCTATVTDDFGELAGGVRLHDEGPAAAAAAAPASQLSWGKVLAAQQNSTTTNNSQQLMMPMQSRASSDYYDARSTASDISHTVGMLDAPSPRCHAEQLRTDQQQLSLPLPLASLSLTQPLEQHWVPKTELLFAPPGLKFVPVPAMTGFAGLWGLIPERTSPHPQPIDVMTGANAMVRKIHASVPGIHIEEDADVLKVIANPSFMPRGLPSAHVETYDKSHATSPSWVPRRDLKLGSAHGHVYYTDDGQLVIRHEMWGLMARKPDLIVEDYLHLEEEGTVIVDRMCCTCCKTGRRVEQVQVVRLITRNP